MRRALQLAAENAASGRGGPFAALVVREGEIVAEGENLVTATADPTAHAEVVAIRRACHKLGTFQLTGSELYTSCEPCPMCLGAIYWARPSRIFYSGTHRQAAAVGFDDSYIYEQTRLHPDQRDLRMVRVLPHEAEGPFRAWLDYSRRVPY
ncbi:MAG TPA: nucleoside deaminase [Bryobacteraceae bacterium]|nr:nucleoside deaminase [Bryobacteraceae bacterium]